MKQTIKLILVSAFFALVEQAIAAQVVTLHPNMECQLKRESDNGNQRWYTCEVAPDRDYCFIMVYLPTTWREYSSGCFDEEIQLPKFMTTP